MRRTLTALATVATACVVSFVGLAAPAHAASPIRVDNPNGDEYASGTVVIVSGWNDSDITETLSVECNQSSRYPRVDVDPGSFSVSVGAFGGPDSCRIYDWSTYDELATFKVSAPPTTVSDASTNRSAFYPLVHDRYQDTVSFRWRQNHDARATIKVVNSNGRAVRTVTPWAWQGRNDWTWNGRSNQGKVVSQGRYRITVRVDANSAKAPVSVKSEIVNKTFRLRKEGNQSSSFATRGNCYASRDSYNQIATLDCWGGKYAKANYRITIPARATQVRGTVDLLRTDADVCCRGRITKGWSRASSRKVTFWAKVTNWRATEVNFVRVAYKLKVRI